MEVKLKDVNSKGNLYHPKYGHITLIALEHHNEDFGIGDYEFHGAPGCHSDWQTVVDRVGVVAVDGEDFDPELHREIETIVHRMFENNEFEVIVEELYRAELEVE